MFDVQDIDEASETEGSVSDDLDSPFWALFTSVTYHKNSTGQFMSEPFNRMPNKK